MKRIVEVFGRELEWTQPSAVKRAYELQAGGEIVATLRFRSAFGSFATASAADGSWTFKRVGFWRTRVTIRPADSPADSGRDLAVFKNNTWSHGGTLELADGRRFRANSNFWSTSYEFKNEREAPLVRFVRLRGVIHMSCRVEITPAGAGLVELPWLVALGWYLALGMQEDDAGVVAGGAG